MANPAGSKALLTEKELKFLEATSSSTAKPSQSKTQYKSQTLGQYNKRPMKVKEVSRRVMGEADRIKKTERKREVLTLLKKAREDSSESLKEIWRRQADQKLQKPRKKYRFRRPVEKLLKRVKAAEIDEIPPDVNIHRHPHRTLSFFGGRGVRDGVERIHKVLLKHGKNIQPRVGWDYNKRQKRLLLGFRQRKLETGCRYFDAIKGCFPRRIKPNSHTPDAIFFFANIAIFISCGFVFGVANGMIGWSVILEDLVEYDMFKKGKPIDINQAHVKVDDITSFQDYSSRLIWNSLLMCLAILMGFVGIYLADQRFHLAYVVTMIFTLGVFITIAILIKYESCDPIMATIMPILTDAVNEYYETIPAYDIKGNAVGVEIRTYRASNLLDGMQKNLLCCGVNGIGDYEKIGKGVPSSCCTPLWNLNPYCAKEVPTDKVEYDAKLLTSGCASALERVCINGQRIMSDSLFILCGVMTFLFLVSCICYMVQARQIRQLRRFPHLRISAGTISQSLQASAGTDGGVKATGVRAAVEANQLNDKQMDYLQQLRKDLGMNPVEEEESSSSSSESDELPVHTVNFAALKNLQEFVDDEDRADEDKENLDKTVEQFAGRFNIVAHKNLQPYVSGVFSTTFQNETNAGLEAISRSLERQFAQHTTDYDWRKLLTKPKKVNKVASVRSIADMKSRKKGPPDSSNKQ